MTWGHVLFIGFYMVVKFLQMTKMPLELLYSLEITNFGYNGNMPFLVLQVDDLLEGLVGLLIMSTLCPVLSFGLLLKHFGYFIHCFVRLIMMPFE